MPIVELDLLIGFTNEADALHPVAVALFTRVKEGKATGVAVATSAYLEYELFHRSKGLTDRDTKADLETFSLYPNLGEKTLNVAILAKAAELRVAYGLSYFDSLHAATALLGDGAIISTDEAYDDVRGLKRLDPRQL